MLIDLEALRDQNFFIKELPIVTARCPGRVSLSKHADYINSDLLYVLDDRAICVAAQIVLSECDPGYGVLDLRNLNQEFADLLIPIAKLDQVPKDSWAFYIAQILKYILDQIPNKNFGLKISVVSDLPESSGLSSSHALMVAAILALSEVFQISFTKIQIIHLSKQIDNLKGFKSGLGDQSAQLFSEPDSFNFIKLFPEIYQKSIPIPSDISLITAPSFIKATKANPEFAMANQNIALYQEINHLAQTTLLEILNQSNDPIEINYLADLLLYFDDKVILESLKSISDERLRGIALYGLAESKRLKELKENFSIDKLAKHLNLSHFAERNYKFVDNEWQKISIEEQLQYDLDSDKKLASHSGIYLASTLRNDQLQKFALELDGVLGSSISGAGLGGNNIILCRQDKSTAIKETLIREYYLPLGLAEAAKNGVHIVKSSLPAKLIHLV